ncbi:hypothetical protein C8R46DRAFT_347619 [Mycena filopes]|nr:hypothetical protein C8R46DRAFT_347619 [Mycena filopes]
MPMAVSTLESSNEKLRVRAASLDRDIAALLGNRAVVHAMPLTEIAVESPFQAHARASSLDQRIAALLRERAVVQKGLDAISYPVVTLPFEITSQIFLWTEIPRNSRESPSFLSRSSAQLNSLRLGHICRVWRQIALDTRGLWNTLEVALDHPSPRRLRAHQSLTQTFLSRAASSPLHISLCGDRKSFRTMLDILVPYSRTWGNISFHCPGLERLEDLQSIHHQLPALTFLKVSLASTPGTGAFGNMFNDAPLLRTVNLSGFGSQKSALPWCQLTSLTLDICSGDHFAQILGWTPNLVHLVIESLWPIGDTVPRHILPLPKLQSVIIFGAYGSCAPTLSLLDADIRVLHCRTCDDLAPFSPPMLRPALLEQFSADVRLEGEVAAPSIECLTPMFSLRILKILVHCHDPPSTNFFLVPLVLRLMDDSTFLPKLESLALLLLYPWRSPSKLDTETISNMLCARFPRGLRHFELRSRGPVLAHDLRTMDLRAKGMQIILEINPRLHIDAFRQVL